MTSVQEIDAFCEALRFILSECERSWWEGEGMSPYDLVEIHSSHLHEASRQMFLTAPLRLLPPSDRPMAARTAQG